MRIDKFLKNSRIIKRRPVAKEACEQGRVLINEKQAKPGDEVKRRYYTSGLWNKDYEGRGIKSRRQCKKDDAGGLKIIE